MRKAKAKLREVTPDPRYNNKVVSKFVNNLMLDGKKSTAYKVFYDAMDFIDGKLADNKASEEEGENSGLTVFLKAVENVTPQVEVRSRRVGGATFQIPQEVRQSRKTALAMKWIIKFSRDKKGKPISIKLAEELMAASKGEGNAYKKKEDTHRMAEANKAFSHFRF